MSDEPLTDDELAEIRAVIGIRDWTDGDVEQLLATIDRERQRAEKAEVERDGLILELKESGMDAVGFAKRQAEELDAWKARAEKAEAEIYRLIESRADDRWVHAQEVTEGMEASIYRLLRKELKLARAVVKAAEPFTKGPWQPLIDALAAYREGMKP